jgi:hypothetical protein
LASGITVTTITGTLRMRGSPRSTPTRSSPDMSGSVRSIVTASNPRSRQRAIASAPLVAISAR